MGHMNKKAQIVEVISIIIILAIATTSSVLITDKLNADLPVRYIGDSSTKIIYNLDSKNESCKINTISIKKIDIVEITNLTKSINSDGYRLDNNCQ